MKGKRGSDSGGKAFGRITGMAVTGILSMFLLTGCSRERMETRREIDRIYKAAEKKAEDRASLYCGKIRDRRFCGRVLGSGAS